jgi:hypothetical protein
MIHDGFFGHLFLTALRPKRIEPGKERQRSFDSLAPP